MPNNLKVANQILNELYTPPRQAREVNVAQATLRGTVTGVLKHVFAGLLRARNTGVELHVVPDPTTHTTRVTGALHMAVTFGLELTDEAMAQPDFADRIEREARTLADEIVREIRRQLAVAEDELSGDLAPRILRETPVVRHPDVTEEQRAARRAEPIPPMPFEKE